MRPVLAALVLQLGCGTDHVAAPAHETRCTLRVSAQGLYVDGAPMTRSAAIASCKRSSAAMVVLEDSAPAAEWKQVEAALRREGLAIYLRGPLGDVECANNPLAKACN